MNIASLRSVCPAEIIAYYLYSCERSTNRLLSFIVPVLTLVCAANTLAFDLQELAAPPQTRLSWVGRHIVQNGMPMQILQLRSSLPMAEILRFYRQRWQVYHRPGERSSLTRDVGDWRMLSTVVDAHHVVLQLKREAGQLTGYLSATPLDTPTEQSQIAEQFPRQSGSRLISSTESNDGGAPATTLILENRFPLRDAFRFYHTALQRRGWKLSRSDVDRGTAVLRFARPSGSLQLALRREKDRTYIFANLRGEEI